MMTAVGALTNPISMAALRIRLPQRTWQSIRPVARPLFAIAIVVLCYKLRVLLSIDFIYLVISSEININTVSRLQERSRTQRADNACIATVIGHQEDPEDFRSALKSSEANATNVRVLHVAVDGDSADDHGIVDVFQQEFPTSRRNIVRLPARLGNLALEIMSRGQGKQRPSAQISGAILDELISKVKAELSDKLLRSLWDAALDSSISAVCITQPHGGMKDTRFTAWLCAIVIRQELRISHLWSSDLDVIVTKHCIENTVATIAGDSLIGAASCAMAVQDQLHSSIEQVYQAYFQAGVYIYRAIDGRDAVLTGANTAFRLDCLKRGVLRWYTKGFLGKKTYASEDAQISHHIGMAGYRKYYVLNAVILVRIFLLSLIINFELQAVALNVPVYAIGLALEAFAIGLAPALRALVGSFVAANQSGEAFSAVAIYEILINTISGPMVAFDIGLEKGG
ncbi:hypothetical protein VTL71DRAFT_4645 [Oculimacula yallundae]|uniref:Glycosyltransferase 2-like domain-containing protein n=1 Tax=Oculimacula yallundae TaxID=86028 RepID=A0ABR4C2J1_9HELO